MNLLTKNARKLYMAAASKGKYQYVCDCSLYDKWNGGFSSETKRVEYPLIIDENHDDNVTQLGNRILQNVVKIEDDSFFNRIYFTYKNNAPDLKTFYNKYVCLVGNNGACLPVDPKAVIAKRFLNGKYVEYDELSLDVPEIGQLFKTGESRFGYEKAFKHGARFEIILNNKVRYRDLTRVIWNYYTDDYSGEKMLSVGSDLNLYKDGDVVVHMGNLWAAYGDINDADDEPSKSIHWEFLCSCERDMYRMETPTPTPSPTFTPTPTPTPSPTPTFEDIVCWCDEYAPWFPRAYKWKSIVSYNGYLYQAHDYQGTEAMDEPGKSHHWFQMCRCIELCYPPEICVRVEESTGWQIDMEHTGDDDCLGPTGSIEFTPENGIPAFTDDNRYINAIRFSYEGSSENPVHFGTKYFALYRNNTKFNIEDFTLIDPFGNEAQHAYCAGQNNKIASHGMTGNPEYMFEDDESNWGIPITSCGGYFTLFLRKPMDISAINKIVWKYDIGDNCGKRSVSFRTVRLNPHLNGGYKLVDPLQDWKVISSIRDAVDYRQAAYQQKFGENRLCQNKPIYSKRRPITTKMPLITFDLDNFNNLSTKIIKASELSSGVLACCDSYDNTIPTYGDNATRASVNGLGVKFFEAGGTLCYNNLDTESALAGQGSQYGVKIEVGGDSILGIINTVAPFINNEVVYVSPSGKYYKGKLESQSGFENMLEYAGECDDTPKSDPTPTPTPTPTSFNRIEPSISLETNSLNIIQRIWNDATDNLNNASISGDVSLAERVCELGINLQANGSFISFPTYKRNMPIISFGVVFEIRGNTVSTGEGNSDSQYIVFQQNNRTDDYEAFYLSYDKKSGQKGCLTLGVKNQSGIEYKISSSDDSIEWNDRHHAHCVIGDTSMSLYLNGVLIGTTEKSSGINYHPTHKMHLGRANAVGSNDDSYMNGVIYSFAFYEDELSAQYIEELYDSTICPATPTPTETPTITPTPTQTSIVETECREIRDDRTWTLLNSTFTSYASSCITEAVWENDASDAWQVIVEGEDCGEIECCRAWLNQYEVGPTIDTIVDGENQITIGKQLYGGVVCVDSGKGDVKNLLINEVSLYVDSDKAIGTIIFMGNVNEHTTIYFTIEDSTIAEKYGYPYLSGTCWSGEIEGDKCMLKELG